MSSTKVALILGAGANIGQHVAKAFAAKGYKIGLVARTIDENESTSDQVQIRSDFTDSNSIIEAFAKIRASLGVPSVVVYNAAAATMNEADDPLSISLQDFNRDLSINTTGAFVAAQQAVLAFQELPEDASRTFIYTGNILNMKTLPRLLNLGVGKAATAHIIQSAAAAYKGRGFKFYYCDERQPDGSPVYMKIDGEAHAELYVRLAENKSQGPWQQTFVKDIGYKQF